VAVLTSSSALTQLLWAPTTCSERLHCAADPATFGDRLFASDADVLSGIGHDQRSPSDQHRELRRQARSTELNLSASGGFSETKQLPGGPVGGSSCTVSVAFTPQAVGPVTGALMVSDDSGKPGPQRKLSRSMAREPRRAPR